MLVQVRNNIEGLTQRCCLSVADAVSTHVFILHAMRKS